MQVNRLHTTVGDAHYKEGTREVSSQHSIVRFAPSPNGYLHLGHAYSALTTFKMAKAYGGQFLLRIEDIDLGRSRDAFVSALEEDLAWLGLSWPKPALRQSQRFAMYQDAANRLAALGVLYPCCATRSEIATAAERMKTGRDPDGAPLYPGRGHVLSEAEVRSRIAAGTPHALRLDMKMACAMVKSKFGQDKLTFREVADDGKAKTVVAAPERWGDAILVRKDVPTSYHLAVVVDDAAQRVTHVTRGKDLLAATDIQRLLQLLLQLPKPIYHHHPLVLDTDGRKLSKSNQVTSLRSLRMSGKTPDDVLRMAKLSLDPH